MLINKYPEIMGIMKRKLEQVCKEAERRYNTKPGSYWYRFFRPDDNGIGGTANTWKATMTSAVEEHLLAQATAITVPDANAYVSFGWYLDADLGYSGYLRVLKQDVIKQEIPARAVYEVQNPKHLYLDFDNIIVGVNQEKLDFIIYNGFGADQICFAFPFMFRIATKSALNLE